MFVCFCHKLFTRNASELGRPGQFEKAGAGHGAAKDSLWVANATFPTFAGVNGGKTRQQKIVPSISALFIQHQTELDPGMKINI